MTTAPTAATLSNRAPVVVAARRTAIGTAGRSLAHVHPDELAASVLRACLDDLAWPPDAVDDVVLGNARGGGGSLARRAALAAGLGPSVPGVTVDRQCAAGLAAITLGAALVQAGQADVVLAGGVESASQAPPGRAPFTPPGHPDPDMGVSAETLAAAHGIGRARQDRYAARSHARAAAAAAAGVFAGELVSVGGVTTDDRPRAGGRRTEATLARFPAAFVAGGTVTAGNSCGVNDGAAGVVVTDDATRRARRWPGLRVLATATAGVDPARCGFGIVPAARQALERAGADAGDVGVVECNEAFAGQVLACLDALGIEEERCCPDGGAIGLGHPWGASGAVLVVRLFTRLVRQRRVDPARPLGLAAIAAGGGQGVAVVLEPVLEHLEPSASAAP
jgi:acetyl-CoA C-acetyltransferase